MSDPANDDKVISDALNLMRDVREENLSLKAQIVSFEASVDTYEQSIDHKTQEIIFLRRSLARANNRADLLARIIGRIDARNREVVHLIAQGLATEQRETHGGAVARSRPAAVA